MELDTRRRKRARRLRTRRSARLHARSKTPGSGSNPGKRRPLRRSTGADHDDPRIGSTIEGKYRILEQLGSGGTSTVYRAHHLLLERDVALKLVLPEDAQSARFRECFFREARVASQLVHKHLVQWREFGETVDGQFYILMDFCPGRTLAQVLREEGPLPPERAVRILIQVLDGLSEAHRTGVVHRDIKPHNLMADEGDFVRILDFGLACVGELESGTEGLPGALVGTPRYMSPEQALGNEVDARSDLYSAGLVLYELLSGRLPFDGDSTSDLLRARIADEARPLCEVVGGLELPRDLEAVLMKALAREPDARWDTAEQLRDALSGVLRGERVEVAVPTRADAFQLRGSLELERGLDEDLAVYRVRHLELEREGLAWVVDTGRTDGLDGLTRRLDVVRRVEHACLAPVVEVGAYADQRVFAFTDWIVGPTLAESQPLSEADLLALARPLSGALAKAHEFGVTHGVIDPRLVTVSEQGPVLHGLGIRSAALKQDVSKAEDVRDLAQLLVGLLEPEARGALRDLLEEAAGEGSTLPDAGALHERLEVLASARARRRGLAAAFGVTALLAVVAGVALWLQHTPFESTPQAGAVPPPSPPTPAPAAFTPPVAPAATSPAQIPGRGLGLFSGLTRGANHAARSARTLARVLGTRPAERAPVEPARREPRRGARKRARLQRRVRRLAARIRQLSRETVRLRTEARSLMADVNARSTYRLAERTLRAAQAFPAAPRSLSRPQNLPALMRRLDAQATAWIKARTRFATLVRASRDAHAVRTLLARFSNALIRRSGREVFGKYLHAKTDREFLARVLKSSGVRFGTAPAVLRGETARARVRQFSYVDWKLGRRVTHTGMRVLLRKTRGTWKIVNVRRGR